MKLNLLKFVQRIEAKKGNASFEDLIMVIEFSILFGINFSDDKSHEQLYLIYQKLKKIAHQYPDDIHSTCVECQENETYRVEDKFFDHCYPCMHKMAPKEPLHQGLCRICNYQSTPKHSFRCRICQTNYINNVGCGKIVPPKRDLVNCSKCKVNPRHITINGRKLCVCVGCRNKQNKKLDDKHRQVEILHSKD